MRPFYSVNFNARMCHMKISVNGVPCFSMDVDGQCSTRYPFNNLLLESGRASIKYEALPLKGEVQLHKEAYLSCEVELYDLDSGYQPVSTMASYETPQHDDTIIPYLVHEDFIQVEVPYTLVGWKQSVKLDRFKDQLRPMVFKKYNSIIAMMRNRSFAQYEDAFRERENIMGVCFYMSEAEKQGRMKQVEDAIMSCSEIVPLSSTDIIDLAADGRLVRLVKSDGGSALRIKNEEAGEMSALELWLQMKPGSTDLTII